MSSTDLNDTPQSASTLFDLPTPGLEHSSTLSTPQLSEDNDSHSVFSATSTDFGKLCIIHSELYDPVHTDGGCLYNRTIPVSTTYHLRRPRFFIRTVATGIHVASATNIDLSPAGGKDPTFPYQVLRLGKIHDLSLPEHPDSSGYGYNASIALPTKSLPELSPDTQCEGAYCDIALPGKKTTDDDVPTLNLRVDAQGSGASTPEPGTGYGFNPSVAMDAEDLHEPEPESCEGAYYDIKLPNKKKTDASFQLQQSPAPRKAEVKPGLAVS